MATKTAFTLEDPFAEKVNDDYAQLTWANEQIYSVADGKHSLLSHILKGDIKIQHDRKAGILKISQDFKYILVEISKFDCGICFYFS